MTTSTECLFMFNPPALKFLGLYDRAKSGFKYVHDITKFLGIDTFEELMVDGTGTTENERQRQFKSNRKIGKLVDKLF